MNWSGLSVALALVVVAFTIHPVVGLVALAGAAWFAHNHC